MIVASLITILIVYLTVCSYRTHVKNENNKLMINLENYEKKEAKQQKSKILGQKKNSGKSNKKKRTRMYHI